MDNTIRKNEKCVIGLPRCDFVFSSTRSCFIAYGFDTSALEMGIVRKLLNEKGIQAEEAGGQRVPGQSAFCAKICSKIITSQFCVILLNNEQRGGTEMPNANVNMEYGLMLGFNKYVVPFQLSTQTLPFNVSGLDTIKYAKSEFEKLAEHAIDQAVRETQQEQLTGADLDQLTAVFLLTKRALYTPIDNDGEKNLFRIGAPLGFLLMNDFPGMHYMYFGNFAHLRPEAILWRIELLKDIIDGRTASMDIRAQLGEATPKQIRLAKEVLSNIEIWIMVMNKDDKNSIMNTMRGTAGNNIVKVFSRDDMEKDLADLDNKLG